MGRTWLTSQPGMSTTQLSNENLIPATTRAAPATQLKIATKTFFIVDVLHVHSAGIDRAAEYGFRVPFEMYNFRCYWRRQNLLACSLSMFLQGSSGLSRGLRQPKGFVGLCAKR
jgi:hypothetical protein